MNLCCLEVYMGCFLKGIVYLSLRKAEMETVR